MSWTAPITCATGDLWTAAQHNTYLRDNTAWLHDQPACRGYNSVDATLISPGATVLAFDSERFDTDGMHSTVTNTSRLLCATAGIYQITANLAILGTTPDQVNVYIRLNGTTYIAGQQVSVTNSGTNGFSLTALYLLAVGHYVEVVVVNASANVSYVKVAANYSLEFTAARVSGVAA